uniref:Reverse transcriptase Ty1/copia-type domain-containing protein n=1 Tax=Solanum lycopersicum TaxID=4081 RepID=A0A3Q7EEH3_SOLLC
MQLDTDCSNHFSGEKYAFPELDETFHPAVKFGDDSPFLSKGKGRIRDSNLGLIAEAKMTAYKFFPLDINKIGSTIFVMGRKSNNQQLLLDLDDGDKEQEQPVVDEDDLIYTQSDPVFLENFKVSIMTEFDMYDLGLMHYILGIDVKQSSSEIFISQKKYAQETLQMYMEAPKDIHLLSTKRFLAICKVSLTMKEGMSELIVFTDSDFAGDKEDRESTLCYCSKKQPIVTLSTTEAEFVAATVCANQAIWLKNILVKLHVRQQEPFTAMMSQQLSFQRI